MILLDQNTAGVDNQKIENWAVWFQTPWGLTHDLDVAIKKCKEFEMNSNLCIYPVPVALTKTGCETFLR